MMMNKFVNEICTLITNNSSLFSVQYYSTYSYLCLSVWVLLLDTWLQRSKAVNFTHGIILGSSGLAGYWGRGLCSVLFDCFSCFSYDLLMSGSAEAMEMVQREREKEREMESIYKSFAKQMH